uniref:Uncharacterized protein n=1 Tax=Arundo donax TaxID=35708 RepID=A0A0A9CR52_ARUDO
MCENLILAHMWFASGFILLKPGVIELVPEPC